MIILFDIISTQGSINGGAEYVQRVLVSLLENMAKADTVYCLYDSKLRIVYKNLLPEVLSNDNNVKCLDINNYNSIGDVVKKYSIDVFYIGIANRFVNYDLGNIKCKCICVIHDFSRFEIKGIRDYIYKDDFLKRVKYKFQQIKNEIINHNKWESLLFFLRNHPQLTIIVVSEFTRATLLNNILDSDHNIQVLYSPEKLSFKNDYIENPQLKNLVESTDKYMLIVSANRELKNARLAISAYKRYCSLFHSDLKLLTIGYQKQEFEGHIVLPYLSASDLEHAYQNAYALIYPSLWEGFGYPPLEIMKYGKPVLSSNVCSMREILGDAPLYFSPFYGAEIFSAIDLFLHSDYNTLCKRSKERFEIISRRQEEDLGKLINIILNQ